MESRVPLARIERTSIPKQVAGQIEHLMETAKIRPGERIPAERHLAERLGVSRGVVREAIKILSMQGLVHIQQGSGTYATEPGTEAISASIQRCLRFRGIEKAVDKIREIRLHLEPGIARLAAKRASSQDVEALDQAVAAMEAAADEVDVFVEADREFHLRLARATHNEMFEIMLEPTTGVLRDYMRNFVEIRGVIAGAVKVHKKILGCVRGGKPEAAARAMVEHLKSGYDKDAF